MKRNCSHFAFRFFAFVILALPNDTGWCLLHEFGYGEPYQLQGSRIVFTNWILVRPGKLDWRDSSGKSLYAATSGPLVGPFEAQYHVDAEPWGIRIIAEPARRLGPIIPRDRPWEVRGLGACTLIKEGDRFRLWASCQSDAAHSFGCMFESTDSLHWQRPELNMIDWNGSKANNIYADKKDQIAISVFIDPHAPPDERYKTVDAPDTPPDLFEKYKQTHAYSRMALETDPGRVHSICGAVSPDGLHWKPLPEPLSIEPSDTQIVCYWDQLLKKYVMFTRSYMVVPRAERQPVAEARFHQFIPRRAIGRTESENFQSFPPSQTIIEPGPDMLPTDTFYTNAKTTIPGAPDQHLLFPAIYQQAVDDDQHRNLVELRQLRVAPDPRFARGGTGEFGKWDGGCIFAAPQLTELPNGDWVLPFTGYTVPHKYPRTNFHFDVGLLQWPKGRLVALEAPDRGEFATVGFQLPGKTARINALTHRAGSIQVQVEDFEGKPIPGFTFNESAPVIGDQFRTPLKWGNKIQLPLSPGTPVMLRFKLNHAKIYALDFE